ncbi:MAG: hypothetical protein U0232_00905 [Thermomicrobiales bacterium]
MRMAWGATRGRGCPDPFRPVVRADDDPGLIEPAPLGLQREGLPELRRRLQRAVRWWSAGPASGTSPGRWPRAGSAKTASFTSVQPPPTSGTFVASMLTCSTAGGWAARAGARMAWASASPSTASAAAPAA